MELTGIVGMDGRVRELRVLRGAGFGLDGKGLDAVAKWRFRPAKRGETVPTRIVFVLPFCAFPGRPVAHLHFRLPDGAIEPEFLSGDVADLAAVAEVIRRQFEVSATGIVNHVDGPDDEVKVALKNWRFKPAMRDDRAIQAIGTLVVLRMQ
ncbi:MAG: hypothetical protein KatS3mg082_2453 [Nitrospiraceae bacterium]|nr:MAG: hypothetical protein KatS3mg082_2453 [Nitrospiraceae bacterium]